MTMFTRESAAKKLIIDLSRKMNERGYTASNDMNISWRIGAKLFLTLPVGVFADTLDEEMIIKMDLDGNVLFARDCYIPSPDAGMHIEIFKQFPTVLGVINAQPPYATLSSILARPLERALLPNIVFDLGVLPVAPYAAPGSKKLAEAVALTCKGHNGMLLQNRGVLVWGINGVEALHRLELAEQFAFLSWNIGKGNEYSLSQDALEEILEKRKLWDIQSGGIPLSKGEVVEND
ncbi:aldolase [Spirochaetia bacterium]|nr:aldolase [Spirochaetia bacterium]